MALNTVNKNFYPSRAACFLAAWFWMVAGASPASAYPKPDRIIAAEDLAAAQSKALQLNRPLVLLMAEPGNSRADDDARLFFDSRRVWRQAEGKAILAMIDLSVSRARATAARFHPGETPSLVGLSPRGVIVYWTPLTPPLYTEAITNGVRQAAEFAPEKDRQLETLEKAAETNKNDFSAQMALANFLVMQRNELEAIPVLAGMAHSNAVPVSMRIRAWADLVRAHFWVGEGEKGRHEAMAMIAELGPAQPEARAAANLTLGYEDAANRLRADRARREFEEAVSAAPESDYGKRAASALLKLKPPP